MILQNRKRIKSCKEQNEIISEIKNLNKEMEKAYFDFQNSTDNDLLEANIYYLNSLRAKSSFLIKKAKENKVIAPAFNNFSHE